MSELFDLRIQPCLHHTLGRRKLVCRHEDYLLGITRCASAGLLLLMDLSGGRGGRGGL